MWVPYGSTGPTSIYKSRGGDTMNYDKYLESQNVNARPGFFQSWIECGWFYVVLIVMLGCGILVCEWIENGIFERLVP